MLGIRSKALDDPRDEYGSAEEMMDAYTAEIIRAGQQGACYLLGWSMGCSRWAPPNGSSARAS